MTILDEKITKDRLWQYVDTDSIIADMKDMPMTHEISMQRRCTCAKQHIDTVPVNTKCYEELKYFLVSDRENWQLECEVLPGAVVLTLMHRDEVGDWWDRGQVVAKTGMPLIHISATLWQLAASMKRMLTMDAEG